MKWIYIFLIFLLTSGVVFGQCNTGRCRRKPELTEEQQLLIEVQKLVEQMRINRRIQKSNSKLEVPKALRKDQKSKKYLGGGFVRLEDRSVTQKSIKHIHDEAFARLKEMYAKYYR